MGQMYVVTGNTITIKLKDGTLIESDRYRIDANGVYVVVQNVNEHRQTPLTPYMNTTLYFYPNSVIHHFEIPTTLPEQVNEDEA